MTNLDMMWTSIVESAIAKWERRDRREKCASPWAISLKIWRKYFFACTRSPPSLWLFRLNYAKMRFAKFVAHVARPNVSPRRRSRRLSSVRPREIDLIISGNTRTRSRCWPLKAGQDYFGHWSVMMLVLQRDTPVSSTRIPTCLDLFN